MNWFALLRISHFILIIVSIKYIYLDISSNKIENIIKCCNNKNAYSYKMKKIGEFKIIEFGFILLFF
jgi:hypothetical protein